MKTPFNVLRHVNQWERAPRDPVTVGAYILAGISGAGLNAVGAAVALSVFGTTAAWVVGFLATTAITSWATRALAPDIGGIGGSRGLLVNASDPAAPHDIVYGTMRKGGIRTYVESTGDENKFLHMIIVLAGHELAGIDDIYLGDEIVTLNGNGFVTSGDWNSKVRIKKHLGNETVADDALVTESNQINANFVGNGIAYLYVRLEYDADVFASGIPLITAMVRGRKVYDPRTASATYSANAALVVRDYLTAGFGLADSAVDELMFATSANVSDEPVTLAEAGSEPRYEVNGVVSSDMSPREIVSRMMTACGGTLFWGQGKWQLHVGYYSPPVKTFTLDDLRGAISLDTRVGARDNFNRVVGTFADKEVDYITVDFPPIESAAFKTEDNEIENTLDMQLPLTTSESAAQRLAKMTLFRAREQMTFSADFGLEAFSVQVGDIVAFTNSRYGWTAKEFEVVGWKFEASSEGGDLRVNLTLRETSEAAFAWNAEESAIIHNNSNLPVFTAGLAINGLTASGGGKTQKDGTFIASSIISWTAVTNAFISHYEIEWKPLADSSYSSTTTTQSSIELSPVIDGVEYIFRVRAITTVGNGGPQASTNYTAGGDVIAPALPTAITATGGFQYVTVKWTRPADKDFNYVEVWENASNTTVGATKIGISTGNEFVRTNLGIEQTRWYFLKSADYSGNISGFTSGASGTTTSISDPDFANGIYSLFTDQGLYAIRDVTSLPPSGAFTGEKVFNRTDGKLYQWTGSAWDSLGASSFADLDGLLQTNQVALDAITNALIANDAVQSENIANLAVTSGKVASSAITTAKVANLAISAGKIADGAATEAKIATNAITGTKISDGAISTPKISAGAVTAGTIAAGAITAGKIDAGAVTAGTIAAGAVTAGTIAANAVTATTIASDSITTAKITAGAVTATEIGANAIIAGKIAANAVTATTIAADSITSSKIAAGAVTATEIAAGTITGDKIVANTITGGLIAASGIITSSAQIGNGLITNALIGDTIQSNNFISGSTGWRVQKTGNAEFNDIDVRGDIVNTSAFAKSPYSGGWSSFAASITLNSKFNTLGGAGLYRIFMAGAGGSGSAEGAGGGAGAGAYFTLNWNGSDTILFTAGSGGARVSAGYQLEFVAGNNGSASTLKLNGVAKVNCNGGFGSSSPTVGGSGGSAPSGSADSRITEFSGISGSAGGANRSSGGGGLNAFGVGNCTGGVGGGGAGGGPFGVGGGGGTVGNGPATPEDSNGYSLSADPEKFGSSSGYFSGTSGSVSTGYESTGFLGGCGRFGTTPVLGSNGGLLAGGGGARMSGSGTGIGGDGGPAGGGGGCDNGSASGSKPRSGSGGSGVIFFKKL